MRHAIGETTLCHYRDPKSFKALEDRWAWEDRQMRAEHYLARKVEQKRARRRIIGDVLFLGFLLVLFVALTMTFSFGFSFFR